MLHRHLQGSVLESLADFPVVLITGARQVGKSTLAQALITAKWPATYLTLDNRTVLDAALTDPDGFLAANPVPLIIDEVQRAPDLLRAIKHRVDRDRESGQFLLTGSANLMTLRTVSESLAGRVALHSLFPFSLAERLGRKPASFLLELFDRNAVPRRLKGKPGPLHFDLADAIFRGGYPPASLSRSPASRRRWFDSYRQTYLERDLRDLANIEHLTDFGRLLVLTGVRSGQMLNVASLSSELGRPHMTVRRYLDLLALTYQISLVPAYTTNVGLRLVKTPKLYFTDTGLACYLSGASDWNALVRQGRLGPMLETWVANELTKLIAVQNEDLRLYFWRTHSGQEVDFLLVRGEEVIAIEVKAARHVERRDLTGIEACEQALGKRVRFSLVLYGGRELVALGPGRMAVPYGTALIG